MNAPRTLVEKIVTAHADGPARVGDAVRVRPRTLLTHDNTAAVIDRFEEWGGGALADPRQLFFAIDHDVENRGTAATARFERIRAFAAARGVRFRSAGAGIGHQLLVEEGFAGPGTLCMASDSHANLYGAVGALGVPVVRTDAAALWASGRTWWIVPPVVRVEVRGVLNAAASGKDVVLAMIGAVATDVVAGRAVEIGGAGVAELAEDDRLALANMTTEWGAIACVFEVDRAWTADDGAQYESVVHVDLAEIQPMIAGPDRVDAVRFAAVVAREQIPIDRAFIGSCAGGRLTDLAAAANVLAGRRVHDDVVLHVAAASERVRYEAERRGIWRILLDAGAKPLPSACGPCIGLGSAALEAGQVAVSASPRNFRGRMGSRDATVYLASPAVVAASALTGRLGGSPSSDVTSGSTSDGVEIARAPARLEVRRPAAAPSLPEVGGVGVFLDVDGLSTDGIYAGRHTYRDLSPDEMARVAFENTDPAISSTLGEGTILIAGARFGVGSSREQAVTALVHAGVRAVIAESVHATYVRNAVNHGFPVVESPAFVAALRGEGGGGLSRRLDALTIDFAASVVRTRGVEYDIHPLPGVVVELLAAGGLRASFRSAEVAR